MNLQLTGKAALVTGASRGSAWPSCVPSAEGQSYLTRNQAEARPRLDALRCLKRQFARRI
jgi:NAD(P)-dependent dehydrogenase (short-subunit alcohol dehydrogenase family)